MSKQPSVSILVPCYNVEKYLNQCLDSIVNQTLKDIEIICINDGSTDSTLDIIKSYAKSDKRIVIIDKENEGYGKSMNRGLDAATGKYIGIVESDDWVDSDMFEKLYTIAEKNNADIVKSDFYEYTTTDGEKNVKKNLLPEWDLNRVITPRKNISIFFTQPSIWSAIYKREFLNDKNIRFLESPGASYQDLGFSFKVWLMADRVYLTPDAYLHYRCDNENSSVKSASKVFCVCDEWNEVEKYISQQKKYYKSAHKLVPHVKWSNYVWNLNRLYGDAQRDFQKQFTREYDAHIKNGDFTCEFFDNREWTHRLRIIYPESNIVRLERLFFNLIKPVYKTKIQNNQKHFVLFGAINIRKPKSLPNLEMK